MNNTHGILIGLGTFLVGFGIGLGINTCREGCHFCEETEDKECCDLGFEGCGCGIEVDMTEEGRKFLDEQVAEAKKKHQLVNEEIYEDRKSLASNSPSLQDIVAGLQRPMDEVAETFKENVQNYNNLVDIYASEQSHDEDIHVISDTEYDTDEDYDKLNLVYYDIDKVVSDDHDNLIHEWGELIGKDALEKFGEKSGDEDIVYIRNHKLKSDYEFVREHLSYSQTVLGYNPETDEDIAEYINAKEFFKNLEDKEE